jgi:serine protease Do
MTENKTEGDMNPVRIPGENKSGDAREDNPLKKENSDGMKLKNLRIADKPKSLGVVFLLLASLSFGFLGGWYGSNARDSDAANNGISKADQRVVLNESQLISDIAKTVSPSVVSVDVTSESQQVDFFGRSQPVEQQSAGTGIIISDSGYIITNRHVIAASSKTVSVTLSDGTKLDDVEVVGRTADNDSLDIAFLKIKDAKGKKLTAAKIGDSGKVQVGDKVVAIGNALGQFQNTVTSGIISGFGRSLEAGDSNGDESESLQNLLQTDTAINEGNSGGPLVNINGEVIGINTAIAAGGAENVGFAIPINDVQGLIKSVLATGKLERPYLGVRFVTLTDQYAYEFNLDVKRGAYLAPNQGSAAVIAGSPADKAGLKEKDIITKVDGTAIDERNSLISLVGRKGVGDQVELTVIRGGKEQTIKVTLEAFKQ